MEYVKQIFNRMNLIRCSSHYRAVSRTCGYYSLSQRAPYMQYRIENRFSASILPTSSLLNLPSNFGLQNLNTASYNRTYSTETSNFTKENLVYVGRIGSLVRMLKLFSLTTSAIGLSLQPYLVFTYQDAPLTAAVALFAALNVFVFVNPLLIHHIAKKYVMEVYFDRETKVFTAVLLTFFARKYSFTFTADDVQVPDVPGLFSILTIKGKPLFVLDLDFNDIEVYKHMMGFDKPLDLSFLKDKKE